MLSEYLVQEPTASMQHSTIVQMHQQQFESSNSNSSSNSVVTCHMPSLYQRAQRPLWMTMATSQQIKDQSLLILTL